jgi:uncharacterized protein YfaA (DUF2138 family)
MTRRSRNLIIAGLAVALVATLGFYQLKGWARFEEQVNRLALDLGKPDGLIQTQALSRLPRDMLAVPMLKDVLSEDFVFYYEQNEDRLSLSGSLRRIAYEHDLQWQDKLLAWVLDEPAEIAVWRDGKGALAHYMIALSRNELAKALQGAATIALKDSQLTKALDIRVGGDDVPVLALRYGRDRTLLLASRGDRIVILSDPGMLLSAANKADPAAEAILVKLLSASATDQHFLDQTFDLPTTAPTHRIALSARYLSFGYQHFFPALDAVRFDFSDGQWTSAVRFAGKAGIASEATARALPARPAACAWLPMAWPDAQAAAAAARPALPRLAGTVAACWYGQSELHMPLFVAELATDADAASDKALADLFAWMVKGNDVEPESKRKDVAMWQRYTDAPYGPRSEDDQHYYLPTLARSKRIVVFSPDDRLVNQALDTLERRYPSVVDSLPAGERGTTLAVFTPTALASLTRKAVFATLSRAEEPTLHDAAQTHLLPRLKALEKYPAFRLQLPRGADATGWQSVDWQALPSQP